MKGVVFIACSLDGLIARNDGSIDWLDKAVAKGGFLEEVGDMGFASFLGSVDAMVMGRNTFQKIVSMNLSLKLWPYGELPVFVLSSTIKELPDNIPSSVKLYNDGLDGLVASLKKEKFNRVYIDGGRTIRTFLDLNLLEEVTITEVPVILGDGISLFNGLEKQVSLKTLKVEHFKNGFIQKKFKVLTDIGQ